ncbi:MAG: GNAT family N-acetyltransferase [Gemmatimonas sp.]
MSFIQIIPFRADLAPAFATLNRRWIEAFFEMETSDAKILNDPETVIITSGGTVFFAMDGDVPIGTVAVLRMDADTFELAKMTVTPTHQGRGIGEQLGHAAIDWAREHKVRMLVLETNRKLAGAIRLYERLGFVHATRPTPSEFARADVYMQLDLSHRRIE